MVVLYHAHGALGFELLDQVFPDDRWDSVRFTAARLLDNRGCGEEAELLRSTAFGLSHATNAFGDEFTVLHAAVPFEEYLKFTEWAAGPHWGPSFSAIAKAVGEVASQYVRFVSVALVADITAEPVPKPEPRITTAVVVQALQDAERLIQASGARSAVDRVHTAMHGYLREACAQAGVETPGDAGITVLFKALQAKEPGLRPEGPRADDVKRIMGAMATVLDALNPVRNHATLAHAKELLGEAEAMLVINAARTLLHYLDAKLEAGHGRA